MRDSAPAPTTGEIGELRMLAALAVASTAPWLIVGAAAPAPDLAASCARLLVLALGIG